jgi:hypothetical protein
VLWRCKLRFSEMVVQFGIFCGVRCYVAPEMRCQLGRHTDEPDAHNSYQRPRGNSIRGGIPKFQFADNQGVIVCGAQTEMLNSFTFTCGASYVNQASRVGV